MKTLRNAGFSLVEVTVAVGIAGFALLAIFGLLPVGLNSNKASIDQTAVTNIARGIITDLRGPQSVPAGAPAGTVPDSPFYNIPIPSAGTSSAVLFLREDGSVAQSTSPTTVNADANPAQNPQYRALVSFNVPGGKAATTVRLLITWPALANSSASPAIPTKFSGSYEIVTALDRN